MAILKLGQVDHGKMPTNKEAYLQRFNRGIISGLAKKQFRNEIKGKGPEDKPELVWSPFMELSQNHNAGMTITELQKFLKEKGFMPHTNMDGVYGYRTVSGVRLFQEYVRTIEGHKGVAPDGIFGPTTFKHIQRWQKDSNLTCEWNNKVQTPESEEWFDLILGNAVMFAMAEKGEIPLFDVSENFPNSKSTLKLTKWNAKPDFIHLIGIRRNQGDGFHAKLTNRDLFVFLINGKVFYFWGSTVPKPRVTKGGFPFLIEGQHEYHFGWHMRGSAHKTYQAFRSNGVLVLRTDKADSTANINNKEDLKKLLYENNTKNNRKNPNPNTTINIHSSGVGRSNWSAGCQVISGADYINNRGQLVNCVGPKGMIPKPYGAYNVLEDLFINYCDPNNLKLYYTLVRVNDTFFEKEELDKFTQKVDVLLKHAKI